jgi:hypothetical protein
MFLNAVIGKPLVDPKTLLALDDLDWKNNEQPQTLFTETRYLPAVMKEAGVVQSTSEVRKNRPDLNISLENPNCLWVKWGKKRLYVIVGE